MECDPRAHPRDRIAVPVVLGSAAAGGLAGLLLGGPLFAILSAGAVGFAATTGGRCGDVARATGETVVAGADRVKQADEKYGVTDAVATRVAEVDEKFKVSETAAAGLTTATAAIQDFDQRHHLAERAVGGLHAARDVIRGSGEGEGEGGGGVEQDQTASSDAAAPTAAAQGGTLSKRK